VAAGTYALPQGTGLGVAGAVSSGQTPEVRMPQPADPPATPSFEAEYTLESPLKCPHCKQEISTIQVLRLVRTRVNFISMLPRRGYVIVCPSCHMIISAELGGILTRAG